VATRNPLPEIRLSRRVKLLLAVLAAIIVLIVLAVSSVGFYVNWLWFGSVHLREVYSTNLRIRIELFFIFGIFTALAIGANVVIAYLLRPPFRPISAEQQNLERYRVIIEPRKRLLLGAVLVLTLLSAGSSAQGHWQTWLLWRNGGSFGQKDPQFHKDISFFAFDYPMYRLVLSFAFSAVIFGAVAAIIVHYLFGALRLQTPGPKLTTAARRHLTVLVGVLVILKAIAYWLDRYGLVFSERDKFTGASYTDVHASLPAKTALFYIALIIAVGVFASLWMRSILLPGIGLAALIVVSIIAGGIIPAAMQQFSVKPNASTKEAEYISRNITSTRQAYDLVDSTDGGTVDYMNYSGAATQTPDQLPSDTGTIDNMRLADPNVVAPTFTQQQQIQNFYGFAKTLDIDRYTTDGTTSPYVVGVRELDGSNLTGNQTSWIAQHTVYTHGYGFVAANATSGVNDASDFAEGDIPSTGFLNITTPQVYYGELMTDYAIVGAKGTNEYDGNGTTSTYTGSGGVSLSNFFTRLAFAVNYSQPNFLLNDAVTGGSKIIFNRDPKSLVEKIAPFLTIDSDPYPIVSNGRIVWMLDGYTTMNNYPYSEHQQFGDATTDSLSSTNGSQANNDINYIRNSVKITVDAYNGTVNIYQWDDNDPLLKAWMKAYPGVVQPKSAIPTDVMAHIRYPEDIFKVQRSLLQTYHVTDPVQFYTERNKWTVPNDPTSGSGEDQPPYYVLADAPDGTSQTPSYQLTSPMKVNGRSTLAAYISVDSDPGPDYGKMTVLQLPTNSAIQGPEQVFSRFNADPTIAKDLSLFSGQGSQIIHGNLLTLPLGGSFLFVEPLYLQGGSTVFPLLQRVLVFYDDKIGYGTTFAQALQNLTEPNVGQDIGNTPDTTSPPSTSSPPAGGSSTPAPTPTDVSAVLQQIAQVSQNLQNAYKNGDLAGIGTYQSQLYQLTQQYLQLEGSAAPTSTAPSSSPSGSSSSTSGTPKPSGS
jgi:uncharacterized membrane protein (UPF0182 family)